MFNTLFWSRESKVSKTGACSILGSVCLCMLIFGNPNRLTAQQAPVDGYIVRVGKLVITAKASGDWFSKPDMAVRVERHDQAVWQAVHRLDDRINPLRQEFADLKKQEERLSQKKAASEIEPGTPLTAVESARLAHLDLEVGDQCSEFRLQMCPSEQCTSNADVDLCGPCPKCTERQALRKRQAESEVIPGPSLTIEEAQQLQEVMRRVPELGDDIRRAVSERSSILATVIQETHSISTDRTTMHFADEEVITVYPNDVLLIRVVESDGGRGGAYEPYDDAAVVVTPPVLDRGELALRMRRVRVLELSFRRQ